MLIPLTVYWQFQMESVRNATHPSAISLPFHVVFVVLCVTGLNRIVARLFGERFALERGELLLLYSLLALSSAIAGIDMLQVLVPVVTYGFRFSEANGWGNLLPYLPPHLTIHDPAVYDHYYTGNSSLWQPHLLAAWLPVVGRWTVFIGLLLWVMLCINAILRRAWMDDERLTFPLVQLPLQITDNESWTRRGLAGNPLFWLGALAAAVPDMLNSLNYFFPSVPAAGYTGNGYSYVDLRYLPGLDTFLTHAPWNAIGETPVAFYPFIISLGMLMPLDFLFSIPVFYWFWKLQRVVVVAAAWDVNPNFPYVESQAFGAYLSFCLLSLYVARRHLRGVWDRACGRPRGLDDAGEPMSYRVAVWGGLVGLAALVGFTRSMGLSPLLGLAFFVIYFGLSLAITRMRAELGTPVHDLHFTGPEMLLTRIGGTRAFAAHDLVPLGLLQWFTQAYRSDPMPYQLESYRMCDAAGAQGERRRWTVALMAGGIFASFVGFFTVSGPDVPLRRERAGTLHAGLRHL